MKKIRAFYYKENYYCFLPGEDLTVEELRASLGGKHPDERHAAEP